MNDKADSIQHKNELVFSNASWDETAELQQEMTYDAYHRHYREYSLSYMNKTSSRTLVWRNGGN
jgi:hypothetical protein